MKKALARQRFTGLLKAPSLTTQAQEVMLPHTRVFEIIRDIVEEKRKSFLHVMANKRHAQASSLLNFNAEDAFSILNGGQEEANEIANRFEKIQVEQDIFPLHRKVTDDYLLDLLTGEHDALETFVIKKVGESELEKKRKVLKKEMAREEAKRLAALAAEGQKLERVLLLPSPEKERKRVVKDKERKEKAMDALR
jgi:hypothetical protein